MRTLPEVCAALEKGEMITPDEAALWAEKLIAAAIAAEREACAKIAEAETGAHDSPMALAACRDIAEEIRARHNNSN